MPIFYESLNLLITYFQANNYCKITLLSSGCLVLNLGMLNIRHLSSKNNVYDCFHLCHAYTF